MAFAECPEDIFCPVLGEALMSLVAKSGFITGGSSGIGLATAAAFVRHGATAAITGRDRRRLDEAVAAVGPGCTGFVANANDDAAMAEALRSAAEPSGALTSSL